uniref:Uncharacterized protein n=1 Tax=Cacopsylla melanoneura TaxID=428564 RepID=A0A8D8QVF3_9HEMI
MSVTARLARTPSPQDVFYVTFVYVCMSFILCYLMWSLTYSYVTSPFINEHAPFIDLIHLSNERVCDLTSLSFSTVETEDRFAITVHSSTISMNRYASIARYVCNVFTVKNVKIFYRYDAPLVSRSAVISKMFSGIVKFNRYFLLKTVRTSL